MLVAGRDAPRAGRVASVKCIADSGETRYMHAITCIPEYVHLQATTLSVTFCLLTIRWHPISTISLRLPFLIIACSMGCHPLQRVSIYRWLRFVKGTCFTKVLDEVLLYLCGFDKRSICDRLLLRANTNHQSPCHDPAQPLLPG